MQNHVETAQRLLIKAADALEQLDTATMTASDIAYMVDVATRLERISRGEPTERIERMNDISGSVTVTKGAIL